MSVDCGVWPKSESAQQWLVANFQEVRRAFLTIHRPEPSAVAQDHPHDLYLYSTTPDEDWDPPWLTNHVYAGGHWNREHADRTVSDLREALKRAGADLSSFKVGHTAQE